MHNVNRLRFAKSADFSFQPGQAIDMRLDRDIWRDNKHPFTMTSLPEDAHLEFTMKSYLDRHGMTEQTVWMTPGDRVIIGGAWGAITDAGPGVFIAGGARVTPITTILRRRQRDAVLRGCTRIFSNARERDIILRDEGEAMLDHRTIFTLADEAAPSLSYRRVDGGCVDDVLEGHDQRFYICGPDPKVAAITTILKDRGVPEDRITIEAA